MRLAPARNALRCPIEKRRFRAYTAWRSGFKTAVVASDAGAYKELVTEGTGTVVPAGDGRALTDAIKPYLANPEKTIAMGEKALEHVQKDFPLDKEASSIDEVYQELFAQK